MRTPKVLNRRKHGDPLGSVYIGRPGRYGNPFVIGADGTRAEVIRKFEDWFLSQPDLLARVRRDLAGRDLVCWCAPQPCHGDVLLKYANSDILDLA